MGVLVKPVYPDLHFSSKTTIYLLTSINLLSTAPPPHLPPAPKRPESIPAAVGHPLPEEVLVKNAPRG